MNRNTYFGLLPVPAHADDTNSKAIKEVTINLHDFMGRYYTIDGGKVKDGT
jgi:hypothetical protein